MSPTRRQDDREAVDEALSALLDGELEPAAADALRARIAREPELAARFERLGELDGRLRQLAAEEPDAARLARLREGLRARLEAEPPAPPAPRVVPFFRRRWPAPLAAALAAGLALYLLAGPRPESAPAPEGGLATRTPPAPDGTSAPPDRAGSGRPGAPADDAARLEERLAAVVEPAPVPDPLDARPDGTRDPVPDATPSATRSATADATPDATPDTTDDVTPGVAPGSSPAPDDQLIASASEVELAVALEYDVLTDLDVIENLELLELMAMLDAPEPM